MNENWKDIPNYEGYQVSDLGRVRTYNKKSYTNIHGERKWKDRILSQKKSTKKNGRIDYRVDLWKDGKPHTLLVARLVAYTFYNKDINEKTTVNHIDGDSSNNKLENLEIITLKENIQHAFNNELMPYKKIKIIDKDKKICVIFRSMTEASKFIDKNHGYISGQIKRGKFENKNYKWEII